MFYNHFFPLRCQLAPARHWVMKNLRRDTHGLARVGREFPEFWTICVYPYLNSPMPPLGVGFTRAMTSLYSRGSDSIFLMIFLLYSTSSALKLELLAKFWAFLRFCTCSSKSCFICCACWIFFIFFYWFRFSSCSFCCWACAHQLLSSSFNRCLRSMSVKLKSLLFTISFLRLRSFWRCFTKLLLSFRRSRSPHYCTDFAILRSNCSSTLHFSLFFLRRWSCFFLFSS